MIACLQESKLAALTLQCAHETLGQCLDGFSYLPASATRGGIIVGWDSDQVEVVYQTDQIHSLTMIVVIRALNASFMLTVVYGLADDAGKPAFLDELRALKPQIQTPPGLRWGTLI
jgi:hypothetical protein